VLVFRERDHAVADVAGWEHLEVFAEPARGATVVSDGDDCCEVADEAGKVLVCGVYDGLGTLWRGDVTFEAAEKSRKASAATDGDYAELFGFGCCHAVS
jgi:limonene-1,2-epoxide hydrolase